MSILKPELYLLTLNENNTNGILMRTGMNIKDSVLSPIFYYTVIVQKYVLAKMSLCHSVASVVCCLSSVHNSQEMLLLPQFLSDYNSAWFV